MTTVEAVALIESSAPWQNAIANGEGAPGAWRRFKASNRGEASALLSYAAAAVKGPAQKPVLATKYGRGMVELIALDDFALMPAVFNSEPPPPPPPPPAPAPRRRGAMVVTAGNISPIVLRNAGVSHVAVSLTGANLAEISAASWSDFAKGAFFVSMGPDAVNEATHVATIIRDNPFLKFAVIDTERHKVGMGGDRSWTENLYRELRARLPKPFPIINVTFGVDAATDTAVNQTALRNHGIEAMWEAYDGDGATIGLTLVRDRALAGGWNPVNLALGDKSLRSDIPALSGMSQVGDVWLWAPDNGPAQEALVTGLRIP